MDLLKEIKKLSEIKDMSDSNLLPGINALIQERLARTAFDFEYWVIAKLAEIDAGHKTNTEADRAMGKIFGALQ